MDIIITTLVLLLLLHGEIVIAIWSFYCCQGGCCCIKRLMLFDGEMVESFFCLGSIIIFWLQFGIENNDNFQNGCYYDDIQPMICRLLFPWLCSIFSFIYFFSLGNVSSQLTLVTKKSQKKFRHLQMINIKCLILLYMIIYD